MDFAPSPARRPCKRDVRSRFEEKASELRREHEQYAQRRRVFFAWVAGHAETLGAVLPFVRSRTARVIRFANVNWAVSFSISATSICVTVFHAGRCFDLRVFDSSPRRVAGGYEDDGFMPEHVVVYPDRHALWEREVFNEFSCWYLDEFATATELWLLHSGHSGFSAALHPGRYATDPDGCLRLPLFVRPMGGRSDCAA